MFTKTRTRKRMQKRLLYFLFFLAFLLLWLLLTFLILYVQDSILGSVADTTREARMTDSFMEKGVQVVIGHYSGNLPKEKHNFTLEELNANEYSPIQGWGEHGKAVSLNITEEIKASRTFAINQFNLFVSDRISVKRSLPDVRRQQCHGKMYPADLPTTSVIVVFHNEAFSTLLRTVHSIVSRSPIHLLREIILVDDYSNRTFLRQPLEDEIAAVSTRVPVKVIRARERIGLIRARMIGASHASGDVLTFLDSHVECTPGWLEPLLARIRENKKNVVCPVIDVINDDTFAYQKGIELFRGAFNWNLQFRWYSMPSAMVHERQDDPSKPIESPTMAGGLFSIHREYFEELGTYDPAMDIWGGENLEMSFRIWQCGGRIEILPCSHVGHIFRKSSPHDFPGRTSGSILNANLLRVAEVWMDEWKWLFYKLSPAALKLRPQLDVSDRIELRKRLRCKSFQWYLDNVFTDHFFPTEETVFGRIGSYGQCLLSRPSSQKGEKKHALTVSKCTLGFDLWQLWVLSVDGRIRSDEHQCLGAAQEGFSHQWTVHLRECGGYEKEKWKYSGRYLSFMHLESGLCLEAPSPYKGVNEEAGRAENNPPVLKKCNRESGQQWKVAPVLWQDSSHHYQTISSSHNATTA